MRVRADTEPTFRRSTCLFLLATLLDTVNEVTIMKRNRNRPTKQNAAPPPQTRDKKADPPNSALPPNKQINKYADEIYGDTEIPSRRK